MKVAIPYGNGALEVDIESERLIQTMSAPDHQGIKDVQNAITTALEHPTDTNRIAECVRPGSKVAIVTNDITRPLITKELIAPLMGILRIAGVKEKDTCIVIATGVHRPNTAQEQKMMFGDLPDGIRVINHTAKDHSSLANLGYTQRGTPVLINKQVAEADFKIITGIISPHQQAGFSGGRKSILPGVASYETIQKFHSFPILPRDVPIGKIDGNIAHEESLEAARMANVDFILNIVPNHKSEILKVVAGDLHEAWLEGVRVWKERMQVTVSELADITITSPGGFPRDINLWQSQKAIASAELVTRKGGTIILVAECKDGLGEPDLDWSRWLIEALTPTDVISRFEQEGYTDGSGKAVVLARALKDFNVMVVSSGLDGDLLKRMFCERFNRLDDAIRRATSEAGSEAKILVLPEAVEYLPCVIASNSINFSSI